MKFIQKIFSVKNENNHKIWTILGLKLKFKNNIYFYQKNPKILEMFTKRNIIKNAMIRIEGLHRLKEPKYNTYFKDELKAFYLIKEKFEYFILDKINIAQIEFTLTTQCTLKCRNCTNYIPKLDKNEHAKISFDEFKLYLDNLLKSVHNIYNLLLLGGEPLLVSDLYKYLDYAASKKQVKNVYITTNGTLLMNDELIRTIKKYNKKVTIWLSNYSANEKLKPILKHQKLLEQIETTGCEYVYNNKDYDWAFVTPEIIDRKRNNKQNTDYFTKCLTGCLSVFNDKLFVCPRAGVFYQKNLYEFQPNETVSLKETNKKLLKKQLINFYGRNYFSACNFCNMLEDRRKPRIMPALQICDSGIPSEF